MNTTLTDQQLQELARLKSYFPFRIVWGAIDANTGRFECGASATMRQANAYARKGWTVVVYKQVQPHLPYKD